MKTRLPAPQGRPGRSGLTIVEVTIVTALIGLLGSGAIMMANMSARAYRTESTSADLVNAARKTFSEIAERVRLADADSVPENTAAPLSTSIINFEPNLGWNGVGPDWGDTEQIRFEYDPNDPNDGVDNDGDGLVDEGQVVWIDDVGLATERRRILCRGVAETLEGETAGNLLDDNGNGLQDEPGFAMDFDGSRLNLRLTLQRVDPYGTQIDHTFERTIVLRNTGITAGP